MQCKLCSKTFPHPRAVSDHWKEAHPAEFRKRQRDKKKASSAPPVDEVTPDAETETILSLIATIEVVDEHDEPVHDSEARSRMLQYVADRVGVKMTVLGPA